MIIPGILETEWEEIRRKLELIRPFASAVHIDLIDGVFAETKTFLDPEPFREYSSDIELELHLMVDDPLQYVKPFADVGFRRFLGHVELMPNQTEFVAEAQQYGEVGLVLDVKTPVSRIVVSYEDLDTVMMMTVPAGASGQGFVSTPLTKVRELVKQQPFLLVETDGGMTKETIAEAYHAGARRFVVNSALFSAPDPQRVYAELSESVAKLDEASVLLK